MHPQRPWNLHTRQMQICSISLEVLSALRSGVDVPGCRNVAAHQSSKAAGELAIVREVKRRDRREDRHEGTKERRRTG
jgi:hypothetical protein